MLFEMRWPFSPVGSIARRWGFSGRVRPPVWPPLRPPAYAARPCMVEFVHHHGELLLAFVLRLFLAFDFLSGAVVLLRQFDAGGYARCIAASPPGCDRRFATGRCCRGGFQSGGLDLLPLLLQDLQGLVGVLASMLWAMGLLMIQLGGQLPRQGLLPGDRFRHHRAAGRSRGRSRWVCWAESNCRWSCNRWAVAGIQFVCVVDGLPETLVGPVAVVVGSAASPCVEQLCNPGDVPRASHFVLRCRAIGWPRGDFGGAIY